jgi:DDE family transposase
MKTEHLKEKLAKLEGEMQRLAAIQNLMLASPDQQISLTDPDSRSMATSGRGSGVVGYNVQVAVDTEHHLIIADEVTNTGSDRSQLSRMAKEAQAVLCTDELEAVADRGYFNGEEILACDEAGITCDGFRMPVRLPSLPHAPRPAIETRHNSRPEHVQHRTCIEGRTTRSPSRRGRVATAGP